MSSSFSTLVNLKENVKQHETNLMIEWILKYRKFSTTAAMEHVPKISGVKEHTLRQYFNQGAHYLRYGASSGKILSQKIIALLDQRRHIVPAYQPSSQNVRREYPQYAAKKNAVPPVATLKAVQTPTAGKFQYGIWIDSNTLRLFDSEVACRAFNDGVVFAGGKRSDIYIVETNKKD